MSITRARPFTAAAAMACLMPVLSATPLPFRPNEERRDLRLFPHDGDVLATWRYGISHTDPNGSDPADFVAAGTCLGPELRP